MTFFSVANRGLGCGSHTPYAAQNLPARQTLTDEGSRRPDFRPPEPPPRWSGPRGRRTPSSGRWRTSQHAAPRTQSSVLAARRERHKLLVAQPLELRDHALSERRHRDGLALGGVMTEETSPISPHPEIIAPGSPCMRAISMPSSKPAHARPDGDLEPAWRCVPAARRWPAGRQHSDSRRGPFTRALRSEYPARRAAAAAFPSIPNSSTNRLCRGVTFTPPRTWRASASVPCTSHPARRPRPSCRHRSTAAPSRRSARRPVP